MSAQENTLTILKDFGLKEKDIEIYLSLVNHVPQKAADISRSLRMHKMQVYRCLTEMEKKVIIEVTFESPRRFAAVPFQRLYDEHTKKLQSTLNVLKSTRKVAFDYWKKRLPSNNLESIETYKIIEGKESVFSKAIQLKKNAKKEICVMIPVESLIIHNTAGIHQDMEKGKIKYKYRCITKITESISPTEKQILKKLCSCPNSEFRHTDANLEPFPGFSLRDGVEFFIVTYANNTLSNISALCSNNRMLASLLKKYFEDQWRDAIDLGLMLE